MMRRVLSSLVKVGAFRTAFASGLMPRQVTSSSAHGVVWTHLIPHRFDKGVSIYRVTECLLHHVDVGAILNSHISNSQHLKRKWSEDMTQNVRVRRPTTKWPAKGVRKVRESARQNVWLKVAKAVKVSHPGSHKAAKVAHFPRLA